MTKRAKRTREETTNSDSRTRNRWERESRIAMQTYKESNAIPSHSFLRWIFTRPRSAEKLDRGVG